MDESLVIDKNTGYYSRNASTKRLELADNILASYGLDSKNHGCIIFPSGISAISFAMLYSTWTYYEPTILIGDELYCETPGVAKNLSPYVRKCNIQFPS